MLGHQKHPTFGNLINQVINEYVILRLTNYWNEVLIYVYVLFFWYK